MNYYDVLRVDKNASSQDIKNSYKKLIKRYHPDLYPGNKVRAESITRDLNEAYDILSDPDKRAMYDLSLETQTQVQEQIVSEPIHQTYYRKVQEEETKETEEQNFQETLRKNIHRLVDKYSDGLSSKNKLSIVIIIIFISMLILLFTTVDYINFQFSLQERRKERELKVQNTLQIDNTNTEFTNIIEIDKQKEIFN